MARYYATIQLQIEADDDEDAEEVATDANFRAGGAEGVVDYWVDGVEYDSTQDIADEDASSRSDS